MCCEIWKWLFKFDKITLFNELIREKFFESLNDLTRFSTYVRLRLKYFKILSRISIGI